MILFIVVQELWQEYKPKKDIDLIIQKNRNKSLVNNKFMIQ